MGNRMSIVAEAQNLDDLAAVLHLQLVLDAAQLDVHRLWRLAQKLRYLLHRIAQLVKVGHALLLGGERQDAPGLADDSFMLAHAAKTTVHLLEVHHTVLDVVRQQVVLAEVAADETLHLVKHAARVQRNQPGVGCREPALYDFLKLGYHAFAELRQPALLASAKLVIHLAVG